MLTKVRSDIKPLANPEFPHNQFLETCESIINKITIIDSFEDAHALLEKACEENGRPVIVSFLNAHAYNLCMSNPSFYQCIMHSDFVLRDGIGMKILFNTLRRDAGKNLNGTDFIPFLLKQFNKQKLALIGTEKAVLNKAIEHESIVRHKVILYEHGFLPFDDYIRGVADTKPEFVLLGMGMPKQEQLSVLLKRHVSDVKLIINGGAILDFMGEKVPRAPLFIRKLGFEWLFRLLLEPRRLFKRYVIGNVVFLNHILKMHKLKRGKQ